MRRPAIQAPAPTRGKLDAYSALQLEAETLVGWKEFVSAPTL